LSGFEGDRLTHRVAAVAAAIWLGVSGCGERQPDLRQLAPEFVTAWFDAAAAGAAGDEHCHGLGLLKHPEFTCDDMLDHARRIDPESRVIEKIATRDCVAGVCGEFVEVSLTSRDKAGNNVRETALVKQDEGKLRLYWYRSDTMEQAYREAHPQPDADDEDPLQAAYDELTARYPSLYEFPRCFDVRVSSSNLAGKLMAMDAVDVAMIETLAGNCGGTFCFGLVGSKIAPVCMEESS
jgi:hypothetical protein